MQNTAQEPVLDREGHIPQQQEQKTKIILDERGLLDVPFLILTVLLVMIGVIMVFSASYARAFPYSAGSKAPYRETSASGK